MATKNPWLKFYPRDWRADETLRIVSLAGRGLWIEMLCLMHTAEPYGHLVVNGQPVTDAQLAALSGSDLSTIQSLTAELEMAGVFSRTRAGTIYSRRMTRDERRRKDGKKASENGAIPGSRRNPQAPEKQQEKLPPPRVVEGAEEPPPRGSEARSQKADKEKNIKKEKRGSRIPEDWEPDEKARTYAGERGLDNPAIALEAEKFKNYWLGKPNKNTSLDWNRQWRTWVLNSLKFNGQNGAVVAPAADYVSQASRDKAAEAFRAENSNLTDEQLEQRKREAQARMRDA